MQSSLAYCADSLPHRVPAFALTTDIGHFALFI